MREKICSKCKESKYLHLFSVNNRRIKQDGRDLVCKLCIQQRRLANKEIRSVQKKQWAIDNPDKYKATYMKTYKKHRDKIVSYAREYNQRKDVKIKRNYYLKKKRKDDIYFTIIARNRSRIWGALKGNKKSNSSIKLLGCTAEFLKKYLEDKFTKGMTWENRGKYGWHIDHIRPCCSFDLSNFEQQKECFHYTNIQPLWATTEIAIKYGEDPSYIGNLEKHGKWNNE